MRSFEATSNTAVSPLKWEIVNAHKGGVTAIYVVSKNFIFNRNFLSIMLKISLIHTRISTMSSQEAEMALCVFGRAKHANLLHKFPATPNT